MYSDPIIVISLRFNISDNNISSLFQVSSRKYNKNYCNEEIACPNLSTLALSRNALDTVEEFVILSNQLRILYLVFWLKIHIILVCTNMKHVFVVIMSSELQQNYQVKWIRWFAKFISLTLARKSNIGLGWFYW